MAYLCPMMKISQLIKELQALKKVHGDLPVCKSGADDYWGTVYAHMGKHDLTISEKAKPDGPRRGEEIKALVIL